MARKDDRGKEQREKEEAFERGFERVGNMGGGENPYNYTYDELVDVGREKYVAGESFPRLIAKSLWADNVKLLRRKEDGEGDNRIG